MKQHIHTERVFTNLQGIQGQVTLPAHLWSSITLGAILFGWQPQGTELLELPSMGLGITTAPVSVAGASHSGAVLSIRMNRTDGTWDGRYDSEGIGQAVTDDDAHGLHRALRRHHDAILLADSISSSYLSGDDLLDYRDMITDQVFEAYSKPIVEARNVGRRPRVTKLKKKSDPILVDIADGIKTLVSPERTPMDLAPVLIADIVTSKLGPLTDVMNLSEKGRFIIY